MSKLKFILRWSHPPPPGLRNPDQLHPAGGLRLRTL